MKDGSYQYSVKMTVPIGPRYGRLELKILGGEAGGFLTMFSKRLPILEGSCRGDVIRFSGEMKTLYYSMPYTAEGTVNDRFLTVVFCTDKGRFPADGTAVAGDEKEKREP